MFDQIAMISAFLNLFAGIGVFLVACTMMSSNLESMSSTTLKNLFARMSNRRLLGVGIGAAGTAVIQSSGATSVMVIGFVNAGIMTLTQAATVIYGANIGTTITGQIVALGMFGSNAISTTVIFSALSGVGAFMMALSTEDRWKTIGGILAGFGMLFVGLSMMSGAMESFAEMDAIKFFLASIKSPFLLVLIGAILTAIIQSSSVMTSVTIAMAVTGLIQLNQGIYLTMGSNIGSCVVAIIAGITSGKNAKRTALIHLLFNISGVILFMIAGAILQTVTGGITYGTIFEAIFPQAPQTQLAMFHTFFNVVTVILILPLTDYLVRLVTRIIPDPEEEKKVAIPSGRLYFIDDHILKTPSIAVTQVKKEIIHMAEIAMDNFDHALDTIMTMNDADLEPFRANEHELNYLQNEIVKFLIKLSNLKLSEKDRAFVGTSFHSVIDMERVGDYAENIIEYEASMKRKNERFSPQAISEIQTLQRLFREQFQLVMRAYENEDFDTLKDVTLMENQIDDATTEMVRNHVVRLDQGLCTPSVGTQYLSLATNAERVGDHFYNIAKSIQNYANLK